MPHAVSTHVPAVSGFCQLSAMAPRGAQHLRFRRFRFTMVGTVLAICRHLRIATPRALIKRNHFNLAQNCQNVLKYDSKFNTLETPAAPRSVASKHLYSVHEHIFYQIIHITKQRGVHFTQSVLILFFNLMQNKVYIEYHQYNMIPRSKCNALVY